MLPKEQRLNLVTAARVFSFSSWNGMEVRRLPDFLTRFLSSRIFLLSLALGFAQFFLFSFSPRAWTQRSCSIAKAKSSQLLRVYVADLPREFHHGLLESYCRSQNCCSTGEYPTNPLLKQHSAEFWLLRDLLDSPSKKKENFVRVWDSRLADVVFVPFFAALSAQIQLRGGHRGEFRKKSSKNSDFDRQRRVVELVTSSLEWRRSNGVDHVFVLADPMAMWHVREQISTAMFLVVDFGGWYLEDAKNKLNSSTIIQHSQVSPIKDVIIPHTHLLPPLKIADDQHRTVLLYFRGARHRHRSGLVREKLWKILDNEPEVLLEKGLPDDAGLAEATRGMRSSEFCLTPAGDTPSSCRLYDAIASLCIPVIVSDDIQLPFEGFVNYEEFCVFVSTRDATQPGWLVQKLRSIGSEERSTMRQTLSRVQRYFEYDNALTDGAVSLIWSKIHSKVPMIKESIARFRRNRKSGSLPSAKRCHCVS
ncbi:probable arabinosyltransferase ARAD1 [Selaginella moellendorffii]|nr:probable arabinosyltransferase ARAD1 [Selaginella moellendorffii]|eukprot:XP_002973635.2 probable arabinosyltransferase ARAD1 [Selaginella moellendorffii]